LDIICPFYFVSFQYIFKTFAFQDLLNVIRKIKLSLILIFKTMKEGKMKNLSLFSADTLDSLAMAEVFGGADNCNGGNCVAQCGCNSTSNSGVGNCNTTTVNVGGAANCPTVTPKLEIDSNYPVFEITTSSYSALY
jgi:hypothetical protein